ncbi:MAG: translation initiation factor IF-2 N-terminal domain-containing protein, partial [Clostridiales Family XIII bacterium]|nr:translation initiation factor IF-2 N-terminal domain-containing protein [Clostridiales Family XIII bacterium]
MSIKIHELAKELNMPSKDVLAKVAAMGIDAKNHMSTISDIEALALKNSVNRKSTADSGVQAGETKIVKVQPKTGKTKPAADEPPRVVVKAAVNPPVRHGMKNKAAPGTPPRGQNDARPAQKHPQGSGRRVADTMHADITRIPRSAETKPKESANVTHASAPGIAFEAVRIAAEPRNGAENVSNKMNENVRPNESTGNAGRDSARAGTANTAGTLAESGRQEEAGLRNGAHAQREDAINKHLETAGANVGAAARTTGTGAESNVREAGHEKSTETQRYAQGIGAGQRQPEGGEAPRSSEKGFDRQNDGRPPRQGDGRPQRQDGDRPPRQGDGRPQRQDGDRPPRQGDGRPQRQGSDRPPRQGDGRPQRQGGDRPPRQDGDRPPRQGDGRPQRQDGDRPPRQGGDRPQRQGGDRPPRQGDGRPPRQGDGRPPRQGDGRPPRPGDGRPQRQGDGRPQRPGDGRPSRPGDGRPQRPGDGRPPRPGDVRPQRPGDCAFKDNKPGVKDSKKK